MIFGFIFLGCMIIRFVNKRFIEDLPAKIFCVVAINWLIVSVETSKDSGVKSIDDVI